MKLQEGLALLSTILGDVSSLAQGLQNLSLLADLLCAHRTARTTDTRAQLIEQVIAKRGRLRSHFVDDFPPKRSSQRSDPTLVLVDDLLRRMSVEDLVDRFGAVLLDVQHLLEQLAKALASLPINLRPVQHEPVLGASIPAASYFECLLFLGCDAMKDVQTNVQNDDEGRIAFHEPFVFHVANSLGDLDLELLLAEVRTELLNVTRLYQETYTARVTLEAKNSPVETKRQDLKPSTLRPESSPRGKSDDVQNADVRRAAFARPLRARKPPVPWDTIATLYRQKTGEIVTGSTMRQSAYRAKNRGV